MLFAKRLQRYNLLFTPANHICTNVHKQVYFKILHLYVKWHNPFVNNQNFNFIKQTQCAGIQ